MTVVVIGAGPAGLAAARAVIDAGQSVIVLDAADGLGGQYWRHLPSSRPSSNEQVLHHQWQTFLDLRDRLEDDSRCEIVTCAHVWAIDRAGIHVLVGPPDGVDRERRTYSMRAVVVATGAHDRVLPVPGWELPGVYSAGGAQALAKGDRVAVGKRVVVGGSGPFLLPVALSLAKSASTVVGVIEASRPGRVAGSWLARPWELVGARSKALEAASYARALAKHRIPYVMGRGVTAIHGTERVESVTVSSLDASWAPIEGTEYSLDVDAVCLGHGFTPRLELAIALGCQLNRRRFVAIDESQRTSVIGVYAAGEVTGVGGADLALVEGTIAGHLAAGGDLHDDNIREARAGRATWRRFAARLDAAHAIGDGWSQWLRPETTICRCEEVTYGQMRTVARVTNSAGLRSLKLTSRAGLGICQGRTCGRTIESLFAAWAGEGGLLDDVTTDRRPIATPVRLGELRIDADSSTTT